MNETSLMLGTADLGRYVSRRQSPDSERRDYLERMLEEYPSRAEVLDVELALNGRV